ncbi:MAG: hypothetical protein IT186_09040 [Acidobacteria bacterium]|nr:hypothetical protein [Acidobacteriota bacterium]
MKTRCRTCNHASRPQIEAGLRAGQQLASVAARYGLPYQTLQSHRSRHMTTAANEPRHRETAERRHANGTSFGLIVEALTEALALTAKRNQFKAVALAAKALRAAIEEQREREVLALLERAPRTRSPFGRPEVKRFLSDLLEKMAPFPEAAADLELRIRTLSRKP